MSDDVLAALRRSADRLDADGRSLPDASFQQRARKELVQALASSHLVGSPRRPAGFAAGWGGMVHRRLTGIGIGVALFGLVAVPALAAPSSVTGALTGAVGAVIREVPPLLVGAPRPADRADPSDKAPAAGNSALAAASDPGHPVIITMDRGAPNRRTTISAAVNTTAEQGEAHAIAVNTAVDTALRSVSITTSVGSLDRDGHGDAVSSVAHQAPPAGETHGRQVSSVARSQATSAVSTNVATSTSHTGMDQHGVAVAAVAHASAPAGETHGQQVSSVARGLATGVTSSAASTARITLTTSTGDGGNGHGSGQPPKEDAGGNGKTHGR